MPCDALKAQGDYGPIRVAQLSEVWWSIYLSGWGRCAQRRLRLMGVEVGERRKARNSRCVSEMI